MGEPVGMNWTVEAAERYRKAKLAFERAQRRWMAGNLRAVPMRTRDTLRKMGIANG